MTLKINLDDEVAERLEKQADSDHVSVEELANQVLLEFTRSVSVEDVENQDPWNDEKNLRRCLLIDKLIAEDITGSERVELNGLQLEFRNYLNQESPFDLDSAKEIHRELLNANS